MLRSHCISIVIGAAMIQAIGCRAQAPIHVWQPPQLESAVGKRVAISNLRGPQDLAEPLRDKMVALAPRDAGRGLTVIDPNQFHQDPVIQLASGIFEPNDLATASAARRKGNNEADYLLRGEVLSRRHTEDQPADGSKTDDRGPLAVSWRLLSIRDGRHAGGSPVVVDVDSAIDRYPDLAILSDSAQILTTAAARDTYRLITPSIGRETIELATSYFLPGSRRLRRANAIASTGNWGEARHIWSEVAEQHPTQIAAIHNLALAAAAAQEFSEAKTMIRKSIRRFPSPKSQRALVWIEQKQRQYHQSFGLDDPPEGWFVTKR